MKKIHILISSMLCLGLASCFDMNQEPQGEMSSSEAFSTVAEIQSYLNMFYQGSVPVSSNNNSTVTNSAIKTQSSSQSNGIAFGDMNSDNLLPGTFDTRLAGQMSSAGSELSDYKPIRNVNFLLQNINRCEDQESSSFKQCVGEAYYFRAAYYYSLLKDYGGVTWVDTPLDPDAGQMQLPRNTRTELTNYILKDLDDAIANLNEQNSNSTGRVHRDVARALKSEVALFAATWEKYHRADNDPFYDKTLTNADEQIRDWLTQAANAAKEVMDRKVWSISRQNNDPLTDYRDLFVTLDLTGNQEVLWWKKYSVADNIGHNVTYYNAMGGGGKGVSASLVDDYLTRDGEPFVGQEKEDAKLVYGQELDPQLRDPRLSQTVFMPGQAMQDSRLFEWPPIDNQGYNQNTTGYSLLKHHEFNSNGKSSFYGTMSMGETEVPMTIESNEKVRLLEDGVEMATVMTINTMGETQTVETYVTDGVMYTTDGTDPRYSASRELVDEAGRYADRLSVNIEIPNETSLRALAPEKDFQSVLAPMRYIQQGFLRGREESARFRHAPRFAPAGQSTQMIVGATPETDRDILSLSAALYRRPSMKRVYYSGFIPVNAYDTRLPALAAPPLRRENRLYQADWLLRFYHFGVDEIVDDAHPDLDLAVDPKLSWALRHPEAFPVDVNRADYETLLRVPGIGVKSAKLIVAARRHGRLGAEQLRRIGIVMKKARYFIDCRELPTRTVNEIGPERLRSLLARRESGLPDDGQLSLPFDENP